MYLNGLDEDEEERRIVIDLQVDDDVLHCNSRCMLLYVIDFNPYVSGVSFSALIALPLNMFDFFLLTESSML